MAVEIDPRTAMKILRGRQARIGDSHARMHDGAMADTVNRMRALEGICGSCTNLFIEVTRDRLGRETVQLRCRVEHSPLELYRATGLGQEPVCQGFIVTNFNL